MTLRTIPRTALDAYLKALKLPVTTVIRQVTKSNGTPSAAELAVDRVDATIRDVAGLTLGDEDLRKDAGRRRKAADERERAQRLRGVATEHAQEADAKAQEA